MRQLRRELDAKSAAAAIKTPDVNDSCFIGSMREDADLLDEIVKDAMRTRQLQAWRPSAEKFDILESMIVETDRPLVALLDEALRLLLEDWSRQQANRGSVETYR